MDTNYFADRRAFLKAVGLFAAGTLIGPSQASASFNGLIEGMKRDAKTAPVSVKPLRGAFSVLESTGGNITIFNGPNATLLVDSGIAEQHVQILRALEDMKQPPVREVINTHWHFDHCSGNPWFRDGGARLTAHENTVKHLLVPTTVTPWKYTFEPIPAAGRPTNLLNSDSSIELAGEYASIRFVQSAHTDGDLFVRFEQADIVATGDIFWNGHYPFIDYDTGGSIGGMIKAAELALSLSTSETLFVPGHGAAASRADFERYRTMLHETSGAISGLKMKGQTLHEIIAAKPTARFDSTFSDYAVAPDDFVALVFQGV
jgi:glyoxylase-like metal-dependent hydrolase (beta-lactamase superfamily II)